MKPVEPQKDPPESRVGNRKSGPTQAGLSIADPGSPIPGAPPGHSGIVSSVAAATGGGLSDTDPAVAERLRELVMARSGSERVRMATGMFESAKRLVQSSLREAGVVDQRELHIQTFLRFHRSDFDEATLARAVAHLRRCWRPPPRGSVATCTGADRPERSDV